MCSSVIHDDTPRTLAQWAARADEAGTKHARFSEDEDRAFGRKTIACGSGSRRLGATFRAWRRQAPTEVDQPSGRPFPQYHFSYSTRCGRPKTLFYSTTAIERDPIT